MQRKTASLEGSREEKFPEKTSIFGQRFNVWLGEKYGNINWLKPYGNPELLNFRINSKPSSDARHPITLCSFMFGFIKDINNRTN